MRTVINIAKFLDREGRVIQIPAKNRTLMPVLQYVASRLDGGRVYTQQEINGALSEWHAFSHSDTLRRYLIEKEFVCRTADGRSYWVSEESKSKTPYWTWKRKERKE